MRIHPAPQGSEEWKAARIGLPTASNFHRILTAKTLKPSSQANGYVHELAAEWLLGRPLDDTTSGFMERGKEMEERARDWYAFEKEVDPVTVGLCLRDDGACGCSPDALVGEDGGLEIKVPSAKVHVGYLLDGPGDDYRAQVQGCLYVTGRLWWDFLSFNPELPAVLVRYERDEEFIGALEPALEALLERLESAKATLKILGCEPRAYVPILPLPPSEPMKPGERVGESLDFRTGTSWQ